MLQTVSQNVITWLANAVTHISNNIGADHMGITTNLIPLASSTSAGLMLGFWRAANEFSEIIWPVHKAKRRCLR